MTEAVKKKETIIDRRFGFEVILVDVPMKEVRGEWVADINATHLRTAVLAGLTTKPGPLSGAEVRFIRLWMEKTTTEFGQSLGVTHAAVLKWEKRGTEPTGMNRATEFRLRVLTLQHVPAQVQAQILAQHRQEPKPGEVGLESFLGLLEEFWTEASIESRDDRPLTIPPELVAQQSLQKVRAHR